MDVDFAFFSSPPVAAFSIFEADCHGLYVNRLCPKLVVAV